MLLLRSATASRSTWLAFVTGFFEPVFYLLALGQGLGALVGQVEGPGGAPISYAAFIAPGLLAASAMNGAVFDSTFNVFFKLTYARVRHEARLFRMDVKDLRCSAVVAVG
jgi:lipooligosaccharide transport system permease protein